MPVILASHRSPEAAPAASASAWASISYETYLLTALTFAATWLAMFVT
jgi:hypothetical protein